jgi:hypothetical protein
MTITAGASREIKNNGGGVMMIKVGMKLSVSSQE